MEKGLTQMMMSTPETAFQMAEMLAKSKIFPGFDNASAVMAAMLISDQMGFDKPTALLRNSYIVDGKLAFSASFMIGLCMKHPAVTRVYYDQNNDDKSASVYIDRKWQDGIETYEGKFTTEEAEQAGLLGKSNWKKYKPAMLRSRAEAIVSRKAIPDLLAGCYTREELERLGDNYDQEQAPSIPMKVKTQEQRNVTPEKEEKKTDSEVSFGNTWSTNIRNRLEALEGHPLGGMEKVRTDAIKTLSKTSFEEAKLRIEKLEALKDVKKGEYKGYIKEITRAKDISEIKVIKDKYIFAPIEENVNGTGIEKKISDVAQKITELVYESEKLDNDIIGSRVDDIASTKNRNVALVRLTGYLKQLEGKSN